MSEHRYLTSQEVAAYLGGPPRPTLMTPSRSKTLIERLTRAMEMLSHIENVAMEVMKVHGVKVPDGVSAVDLVMKMSDLHKEMGQSFVTVETERQTLHEQVMGARRAAVKAEMDADRAMAALKPFADAKEALIEMGFTKDEQAVISSVADNGGKQKVSCC